MQVLLDTCCIIWAASDPDRLPTGVKRILQAKDTTVFLSAISCAEIACLAERGRIVLDRHWRTWFNRIVAANGWGVLDLGIDVIQEAYSLPGDFHRDPADRIITGTARLRDLTIMTADTKILDYPHVTSAWGD